MSSSKLVQVSREIKALCSSQDISFVLVRRSTNGLADFLPKVGVDREYESFFFY